MGTTILNKDSICYGSAVTMETITCISCGIPFAVPSEYKSHLQSSQESFYCPNGHSQRYAKSTEEILKERLEKQKQEHEAAVERLRRNIQWANHDRDNAIRQRTAIKGQMTKLKNRVKNGVCPCCNRTFQNLQQHMATQHPDFKTESHA